MPWNGSTPTSPSRAKKRAQDALRFLAGHFDVTQLFSHAEDLGPDGLHPDKIFTGFGREWIRTGGGTINRRGGLRWHPGFAWACTRRSFDHLGGLYKLGALGSGDNYMAMALLGRADQALQPGLHLGFAETLNQWQRNACSLRLGYMPGVLRHFYHGDKKLRGYENRFKILIRRQLSPLEPLERRVCDGLVEPFESFPEAALEEIHSYFLSRDEDDVYMHMTDFLASGCPARKKP